MNKDVAASSVVALFFALSVAPASAQGVTRIEQGDTAIVYSGNWYVNENGAHSGGTASLTNARGARAVISFTGTGVSWIGVADGWAGLATVYVDGAMTIVNSYSAEARYQDARLALRGLRSGPHTLTIEVTHERVEGTDGSWVWIDAFDIENGQPIPGGFMAESTHVEEDDPALQFFGRWYSTENPSLSGGRAVMAMDAGARVSIGFRGSGISWLSYRDEWSGVARVFLDDELKTTADNYLTPSRTGVVPYSITGLQPGVHILTIEATGTHNESSRGGWIWLDGFDVVLLPPAP
jgi:hypothetical protein